MNNDILFKRDDYIFSYRVAGILIQDGKILLQHLANEPGHSVPGGHAEFGETNDKTLIRETQEEIGADIVVHELMYIAEIFFPWNHLPCHQICLFYRISLKGPATIPLAGEFPVEETLEGRKFPLVFVWVPLSELDQIILYPENLKTLLPQYDGHPVHFVYHE